MEVETPFIGLEEGWSYMETGITKLKRILEGEPEPQFESKEYTSLYTVIYNMCTRKPPHDYSQQLYDRYHETIEDYCKQTSEECLKKERERVTLYLSKSTEPKLVEQVQNELLVVVAKQLLENEHSGCRESLRDDKMDDLSRMFRLYRNIPQCLEPVVDIFKQHVTAEGHALIKLAEDAATSLASNTGGVQEQMLIRTIVELHEKRMAYVTECFQNHTLFHKALKEAFEIFCNKTVTGSSSAELLATFCDNILKKGGGTEKLDDAALEETLENVVKLLAYVSDKDFFAEFCRKKQSRRLLFDRSGHDEHEKSILSKLKEQSGGQFTSKMGGMVTDMTLARENQNHFEEYLKNSTVHPGIDLTVTVLTTGFWPTYKTSDLKLPSEMVKCVETFKIYSLGTCHMNGKFDQKPIELIVSSHQATVLLLLLFNNTERLSYNEMLEQLKLSHDDLLRVLHSVSCAKYKILKKEPMSKAISKSDVFEFNPKLSDRMRRIRVVPLPPMDERKKVVEDVDKDRGYAIDACVVRIMKARKVLAHQQLPDIKMVKKRVEDLISGDYLERDTANPNSFKYAAWYRGIFGI